ncbi:spore germination protein [Ectobacillus sp. JY-23]|uniref:GerAB/ArcD/ProY family transporter n=1 Tax=Ectobacillus sp. JY-23 TaxID=2933872 RepID=UPI001FF4B536|nr:GerAB/ArcD/ProY family transporter [Ectobacillus sp. JY-23]UOY94207.1 spore germination protein [Ectobacillus sp. JY-23]
MSKNKIDGLQLFCLIMLFELGSALLFDVGKDAGKQGWMTVLLGTVIGCILYFLYTSLYKYYPTLPLTSYAQKIMGKYIGWTIGVLYVLYFIYLSARVLRDFSSLLIITAYNQTPLFLIALFMIVSTTYLIMHGLKVMGRLATLCFAFTMTILITLILLEALTHLAHLNNLLPIVMYDWKPIMKSLFPTVVTVPFGEMVAFTMLLPFLKKSNQARKVGWLALLCSGIYLSFSSAWHVMILGEKSVQQLHFPILSSVSLIDIANFVTRLGAFVVTIIVILGFFKISVFFYCAVVGISDLLKVKNQKRVAVVIGLLILTISFTMASNFLEHLKIGFEFVPYYLHIPFQIIIPSLLLFVALIKKRLQTAD